jgi:XTP/dITP diphosphohydrolase
VSEDWPGIAYLTQTMARLRAPGGCPWDAQQTHDSLVQYLLEEAYEAVDAIEHGDRDDLREELGDVLLQVVFHAAIATEDPDDPFDIDDLARGVADKLVRRHPHVFATDEAERMSAEESYKRWDRIKADEKSRASVLDGIPAAQSPLARAQKVFGRARRGGVDLASWWGSGLDDAAGSAPSAGASMGSSAGQAGAATVAAAGSAASADGNDLGERLAALAQEADAAGLDAERELRAVTRRLEARVRRIESEQFTREESRC